jgi:nucleosome assembly protein 1-like 1
LKNATGTEIDWKAGKNLCVEEITKKQRAKSGRNKGQVRTVTVKKPKQSFFQFFSPKVEEEEEEEEEEKAEGEDDQMPIKIPIEEDYDIGHAIRTSIIPRALDWFTGDAAEEFDYLYGDEDDDEDDDEEEGDDDEEEEEEEEPKPKAGKGKKSKGGNASDAASGEKPAECKQN